MPALLNNQGRKRCKTAIRVFHAPKEYECVRVQRQTQQRTIIKAKNQGQRDPTQMETASNSGKRKF